MPILKMQHDNDPRKEITDKVQSYVDEIQLTGAQVLIGIYVRPEKTAGGIMLPDQYREEDIYQGKAGLILKMGPIPFDEEDREFFGGKLPQAGDWVVYRPSHGYPLQLENKVDCRILEDRRLIKAIIPRPDMIF